MNFRQLFRRWEESSAVAVLEPEALVTAPVDLRLGDLALEHEYRRVADKLGVVKRPATHWRKLACALDELMIPVYDFAKVKAFLDEKAAKVAKIERAAAPGGSASWCWYPLKCPISESDRARLAHEESIRQIKNSVLGQRMPNGAIHSIPYLKEVPLPALLTAEKIEDRLPGEVTFLVSDVERYPDPFLAVMLKSDPDQKKFVVERWDEPSFRG